ncbi:MAG: metallophosphoesterase [Syntrophobacteraceae bacterium]
MRGHRAANALLVFLLLFVCGCASASREVRPVQPATLAEGCTRLVALSDPHLPGNHPEAKRKVLEEINSWTDVNTVVVLGDLTEKAGSPEEYAFVKQFFAQLRWPLCPVAGNHDYIYRAPAAKLSKAPSEVREEKLRTFRQVFSLPEVYYKREAGGYLLVFLSPDDLHMDYLTQISQKQMGWFRSVLEKNRSRPTIVFFHGPLKGTLQGANHSARTDFFIAQPAGELDAVLKENPQVFLWVSGHTHTAPTHLNSAKPVLYDNRITNLHNPDMNGASYFSLSDSKATRHDTIWSNSLYLCPDGVVVRTYDHKKGQWLEDLEKKIPLPAGALKP